ncbi:MAG: hypothetical protein IPK59_00630 [Rhodospirillaceae bacterium]|nr:hypothetical protein [Rhodospirillaceae bacterium]
MSKLPGGIDRIAEVVAETVRVWNVGADKSLTKSERSRHFNEAAKRRDQLLRGMTPEDKTRLDAIAISLRNLANNEQAHA